MLVARQTDQFPYVWLLTQDSKATAFTRLLFAMRPWYASEPRQLGGARVASVIDPISVSRAWALQVPARRAGDARLPAVGSGLGAAECPWLARLWGDGLIRSQPLAISQEVLDWSRSDPDGLLAAARHIAAKRPLEEDANARRLMQLLTTEPNPNGLRHYYTEELLARPARSPGRGHPDPERAPRRGRRVLLRYGYTDPSTIGGYLDRDLPNPLTRRKLILIPCGAVSNHVPTTASATRSTPNAPQ